MITVARERIFLTGLRQAYLLSRFNAARLSSRTVLFLHATDEPLDDDNLHRIFGNDARRHWTATDLSKLESLVDDRSEKAMMLEAAEVRLTMNANKKRLNGHHKNSHGNGASNGGEAVLADKELRPTHRLKSLIGKKVDTIKYSRDIVSEKAKKIQELRESDEIKNITSGTAVFVEFATQAAAFRAYQQLTFHQPLHLDPKFIGMIPKEVIWKNLTLSPAARLSKGYLSTAFVAAIILLWSIPIGFVGTVSNINYLADKVHFLRFIYNLPDAVLGLITGLLPPFLMSTFVSYVPKFFRCKSTYNVIRYHAANFVQTLRNFLSLRTLRPSSGSRRGTTLSRSSKSFLSRLSHLELQRSPRK